MSAHGSSTKQSVIRTHAPLCKPNEALVEGLSAWGADTLRTAGGDLRCPAAISGGPDLLLQKGFSGANGIRRRARSERAAQRLLVHGSAAGWQVLVRAGRVRTESLERVREEPR